MFKNLPHRNQTLKPGWDYQKGKPYALAVLVLLLLAASLVLTACQAGEEQTAAVQTAATEEVQASPTAIQEPTQVEAPTETPGQGSEPETVEQPTDTLIEVPALGEPMPGCTVVSFNPTPEPTLQALFPPPGDGDWIKGSDTAEVTVIEYSDFQ